MARKHSKAMWRRLSPGFALLSATVVGSCAGADLLGQKPSTEERGPQSEFVYYSNQADADAALAAFDRENPSCQLWTNWQKVCTRINGKTHCRLDPTHPVQPTAVFCQAPSIIGDENAVASYLRFCEQSEEIGISQLIDGQVVRSTTLVCSRFDRDRPFSGLELQALRTGQCLEWSNRSTGEVLCREDEVGACDFITTVDDGAFCSQKVNSKCDYLDDAVTKGVRFYSTDEASVIAGADIDVANVLDGTAVHSMKCE